LHETGVDVVRGWEIADGAKTIIARGTSISTPQRLYTFDTKGRKPHLLLDPAAERFEHVTFGDTKPFVATMDDGGELDGRMYYPRDYKPGTKYPVIVYYYGGTSPITRDFGGRYPKNIWAGHDYFIYVPNPSGALGYGQEYAARHVNDWGRLTAPEVIAGTKEFLAAHPDADSEKVGCIGASYGGFLTMYLVSQTDIFTAAVSHAGISSISSYWAEGYWGYGYGARALAHSFPWNDRELYVEQSPLFHADKIHTPLLLLHGFDDTNVPKGESDGLYIALKMLDRDVEYVQIEGQDHHILDHDKRIRWNDTILAYFDWKLKGDNGWWEHLYPETD
jgi:dipeptidyl aminopeptidase/acylaminoacyl peptidase